MSSCSELSNFLFKWMHLLFYIYIGRDILDTCFRIPSKQHWQDRRNSNIPSAGFDFVKDSVLTSFVMRGRFSEFQKLHTFLPIPLRPRSRSISCVYPPVLSTLHNFSIIWWSLPKNSTPFLNIRNRGFNKIDGQSYNPIFSHKTSPYWQEESWYILVNLGK